ncbi:MAG: CHAD domain-containing protein, partial [Pseudomonadota bacterium]|nr:CHAD domain-containing protein [Pseudomonadota bacterium]
VQDGVRRIALEQIGRMLRTIDAASADTDHAVHDLRKRCKKVRGLLRLVRPRFKHYRKENAAFRDIGASISVIRDAAVLTASYDAVLETHDGQSQRHTLRSIRRELSLRSKRLSVTRDPMELIEQARAPLMQTAERVQQWKIDADGFESLQGGLRKTYRQAQKAMRKAAQQGSPAQFHTWRKRCKDHGYHAFLLRSLWSGPMKAYAACAEELADLLGNHHDLAVLMETIGDKPSAFGASSDVEIMLGLIRRQQTVLAQQSFALGHRVFAQSPKALVSSWAARYAVWRNEEVAQVTALRDVDPG